MENDDDFYDILGLQPDATAIQIKKAFRSLSGDYHPDRTAKMNLSPQERIRRTEFYKKATNAYATLSDADRKKGYDRNRTINSKTPPPPKPKSPPPPPPTPPPSPWPKYTRPTPPPPPPTPKPDFWERIIAFYKFIPQPWKGIIIFISIAFILDVIFLGFSKLYLDAYPLVTPTPVITSVPKGTPKITVDKVKITPTDDGLKQEYTITGQVSNPTSQAIVIEEVGFYIGDVNTTLPPYYYMGFDNVFNITGVIPTPVEENVAVVGQDKNVVPAYGSFDYTSTFTFVPWNYISDSPEITGDPNKVTATFTFPMNKGDQPGTYWKWYQ